MWTRRQLLQAGSATALLGGHSPRARAVSGSDRRFLFVFVQGGWDQTWFFTPSFDQDAVDMPDGAQPAEVGGIPFVEHELVPSARTLLEAHASRTCLLSGFEVRAVAHDICQRVVCTNSSTPGTDHWASILAGNAVDSPLIPLLHLSGPIYADRFSSSVVRVGTSGQLGALLDGSALTRSDTLVTAPSGTAEALEDAAARARAEAFVGTAPAGRGARIADIAWQTESRLEELQAYASLLHSDGSSGLADQLDSTLSFLSTGLSRCAVVAYKSWEGVFNGWDTHEENHLQAYHYEELFSALHSTLETAAGLPGAAGGSLADELVVVVMSEMGRTPKLNAVGGKDHWTFTSAMLLGDGVAGGQVVGGYDEYLLGRPVDLASGEPTKGGVELLPGHLGATLLALGDVDPGEYVEGAEAIPAMLD